MYPEIKLKGLDRLAVSRPVVEITAADIERVIDSMRRSRRTLAPVTRAAQQGDVCTVDFEGFVDGAAFAGGKGENAELELGQGRFLPDLENGIAGHAAGESFTVDVQFPADYRNDALKGKQAQFKVALKQVQEPKLPDVDAEFLAAHNVDPAAGPEGLREKVRVALGAERDKAIRNRMRQQVLDQLVTANPIDVPAAMVQQEIQRLREETAARFNVGQVKPDQKQKLFPDDMLEPTARRRVALGLLIAEVLRERKIALDPARLERLLDEMAADYQQPEQIKAHYRGRPELMQGLRALVLEEQVVESLLSGIAAKDAPMALDDLLKPVAAAA